MIRVIVSMLCALVAWGFYRQGLHFPEHGGGLQCLLVAFLFAWGAFKLAWSLVEEMFS